MDARVEASGPLAAPERRAGTAGTHAPRGGRVAVAVVGAAWVAIGARYLGHRIALSSDSVNNHVHVWYIAHERYFAFRAASLARRGRKAASWRG